MANFYRKLSLCHAMLSKCYMATRLKRFLFVYLLICILFVLKKCRILPHGLGQNETFLSFYKTSPCFRYKQAPAMTVVTSDRGWCILYPFEYIYSTQTILPQFYLELSLCVSFCPVLPYVDLVSH